MLRWTTKHHITWSKFQMHGKNCIWTTNHENLEEARPLWLQLKHAVNLFHQQVFLCSVIDKVCSYGTACPKVCAWNYCHIWILQMLCKWRIQKWLREGGKTQGHSLQPFVFIVIFLSLAGDNTSFDFQVSLWLNEWSINHFGKSQRKVFHQQEVNLLTLPCHQQHHTVPLAFPQLGASFFWVFSSFTFSEDPEES